MNLRRAAKRGVFGVLATIVALGMIWVGAHVCLAESRPVPFAQPSDLPALPNEEENGYGLVARATPNFPQLPKTLPTISGKPAKTSTWAEVEVARGEASAFVDRPEIKAALAAVSAALDRPTFVDVCADRNDHACRHLQVLAATRLESQAILALSLEGQNAEASRRLVRLIHAEQTWLHAPRSFLSQRVSLSASAEALSLAKLVGPRLSPEQRAPLAAAVQGFATKPVDLGHLVKVTYLEDRALLDDVVSTSGGWHLVSPTSPPPPPTLSERFVAQRLLDRGRTERLLTERAQQTVRWAEKGDVPLPTPTQYGASPFLWVYNPVGKMLIDGAIGPTLWEGLRDDARALAADAAAADLR